MTKSDLSLSNFVKGYFSWMDCGCLRNAGIRLCNLFRYSEKKNEKREELNLKTNIMKKYFLVTTILLAISLLLIGFFKKPANGTGQGFAVVELFTSEGCSSCPPADEAVADIARQYKNNVFILAYHVDYWNYLGWKDMFSNSAYSNRQKQYASLLNVSSVYTPQIIVNGKTEFVGSDKIKLEQTISKELNSQVIKPFEISTRSSDGKKFWGNL
jgi:hypothetical protein